MRFNDIYWMFKDVEELKKEGEELSIKLKIYEIKINNGTDTLDDREQYKKYDKELLYVIDKISRIMEIEIIGD